jgi:hypothetical protein
MTEYADSRASRDPAFPHRWGRVPADRNSDEFRAWLATNVITDAYRTGKPISPGIARMYLEYAKRQR